MKTPAPWPARLVVAGALSLAVVGVPVVAAIAQVGPANLLRWIDPAWRASRQRDADADAARHGDYGPILRRIWAEESPGDADFGVDVLLELATVAEVEPLLRAIYRMHPDGGVAHSAGGVRLGARLDATRTRPPRLFADEACAALGGRVVTGVNPTGVERKDQGFDQVCYTADGYWVDHDILSYLVAERDGGRWIGPLSGATLPANQLREPHPTRRWWVSEETGQLASDLWHPERRVWTRELADGGTLEVRGPPPIRLDGGASR